jgi:hypothetical protein
MARGELASLRKDVQWSDKSDIRGASNPNYGGGKYVDDKGYVRILSPDHPHNIKGYIYEHRAVIEKYLSRLLEPWETVHHINEIKSDNRVQNLFLCTHSEHSAIHREGRKPTQEHREKMRQSMKKRNQERRNQIKQKNRKKSELPTLDES